MQRRSIFQRLSSSRPTIFRINYITNLSRRCYNTHQRSISSNTGPPQEKLRFGQPVFETHPHLLKSAEVTPGCSALEYALRRAKLASKLPDGGLAIIPASYIKYRSGPVFYEFHQDPDFYYLTGFLEPEAICAIEKTGPDGDHIFHMFVRDKDPKAELWDGARSGVQAAVDVFNADEAGDIDNLRSHLAPLIAKAESVYTDVSLIPSRPSSIFSSLFSNSSGPDTLSFAHMLDGKRTVPLKYFMHGLRVFKSESEVANMRKAGKISGRAFNMAMQERFRTEKNLWAFLDYHFKVGGCEKEAYVPVVAGGENACTIHYTRNDDILKDGDLVLVDAGGQYGGYTTDITRTWPVSGRFTPAQRDLYTVVLSIQKKCIGLCRENANLSLDEIHSIAEIGLKDGLKELGFDVNGRNMEILFPHHLGHFVGIDIHDCASYSRSLKLKEGQCITIEPGIYVPNDERWPESFRGMGIRIEDSICVGEESPIVLSVEAAKEIVDIETLGESIQ